jgi:hypothetical protein
MVQRASALLQPRDSSPRQACVLIFGPAQVSAERRYRGDRWARDCRSGRRHQAPDLDRLYSVVKAERANLISSSPTLPPRRLRPKGRSIGYAKPRSKFFHRRGVISVCARVVHYCCLVKSEIWWPREEPL